MLGHYALNRPGAVGLNYRVYHVAAEAVLSGGDLYAVSPQDSSFRYRYPPVTVLAFLPSPLAGNWRPGYLVTTAASVAATAAVTRLLVGYLADRGHDVGRPERFLVFGFLLAGPHAAPSLAYGQVNHLLVAALGAGLVWLARDRELRAGVALALPAFVKAFPAFVGWWLLRRRAWRTIGVAVATTAALTAAGLLAFGVGTYRTYLSEALLSRRATDAFAGGLDPGASYVTLRRPLSVVLPGVDPVWYAVGAGALLAPALAALYRGPLSTTDRHVAVFGTLLVTYLFFPSYVVYYPYVAVPLVVVLYDLPAGRARRLFVAGAVLANVPLTYNNLRQALRVAPVDPATAAAVRDTLRPVLGAASPVLLGCLAMLAACLLYRVDAGHLGLPTAPSRRG